VSVSILIDEKRWPLVYAVWPGEPVSDEEFARMVDRMSSFSHKGEPFVVIHDARKAVRPSPKQRALAAERQKQDTEMTRRYLRGMALVVSNPIVAGVVTAINWIAPPPYPQKTFSKIAEAEEWVTRLLPPKT
jgi:hypothetical protein